MRENLRFYFMYCVQMLLAIGLSIFALRYNVNSKVLLVICSVLFVSLSILPMILTRFIVSGLQKRQFKKAARFSRLRYLITWAKIHEEEADVFSYLLLVSEGKLKEAIEETPRLLDKLPFLFHVSIYAGLIEAHCRLADWKNAIKIFEQRVAGNLDHPPIILPQMIEAYCETGDIAVAASLLLELENYSEKEAFIKEIIHSRICIYAYLGDLAKVKELGKQISEKKRKYWQSIALIYSEKHKEGKEVLLDLEKDAFQRQHIIRHKLKQIEDDRAFPQEFLPSDVKDELKKAEKKIFPKSKVNEDPLQNLGLPSLTLFIIACNLVVFFLIEWVNTSEDSLTLLNFGSNAFEFVRQDKQYWRFFSAMFLHGGYTHLILNLTQLYIFGRLVENFYGKEGFFAIYFISGIASSLVSLLWNSNSFTPMSVGASGAICGLIGANTYFFIFRCRFSPTIRNHFVFSFGFIIVTMGIMGYIIRYIDNAAHFAGIFGGFILAGLIPLAKYPAKDRFLRQCWQIINSIVFLGCCWAFLSAFLNYQRGGYPQEIPSFQKHQYKVNSEYLLDYSLPFTWQVYQDRMKSYSLAPWRSRNAPLDICHDYYSLNDQGHFFDNLFIQGKKIPPLPEKLVSSWLNKLQRRIVYRMNAVLSTPLSPAVTGQKPASKIKFSNHTYWHFQIYYQKRGEEYCEDYYFLRINEHWLGELSFSFTTKARPNYSHMMGHILSKVRIYKNDEN